MFLQTADLFLAQALQDVVPDLGWLLRGVDSAPDASLLVVLDNRLGLLVVGDQSLLQGVFVVVRSLNQRLAGDVVGHVLLRRVEQLVVGSATGWVDQSAGDSRHQQLVVDLQLHGALQRRFPLTQHAVQLLGLRDGSGETVQDEAVLALLVVFQLALDHVDHDFVRNQTTFVHDLLGLNTQFGFGGNLSSQHVTCGQVAGAELFLQVWRLGALSGAWRTNQHHSDGLWHVWNEPGLLLEGLDSVLQLFND